MRAAISPPSSETAVPVSAQVSFTGLLAMEERSAAPVRATLRDVTPDTSVLPPTTTSIVLSALLRVVAPVSPASFVTAASR